MDKTEAFELIEVIDAAYDNVEFNTDKTRVWINLLMKGEYTLSKNKLEDYMLGNKFPPTISDFLIIEKKNPLEADEIKRQRDEEIIRREENDPELRIKREEAKQKMIEKLLLLKNSLGGDSYE